MVRRAARRRILDHDGLSRLRAARAQGFRGHAAHARLQVAPTAPSTVGMDRVLDNYLNLAILARYYPAILDGFWVTCRVAAVVIVIGILFGLLLAVVRTFALRPLNALIVGWIDFF